MIEVIQSDIMSSTSVAAALMDGGMPAAENNIIINLSIAPNLLEEGGSIQLN